MPERLVTHSYCSLLAANFLLYFGFWMLVPILPFYLTEVFRVSNATVGVVLSCYTLAALVMRPFSGYLLDSFRRKPLWLFAYVVFVAMFAGYLWAGALTLFIVFRVIHGLAFGTVTVGGNTLVIDVMPASRRGEGLGYYGLMNNTAMSTGPMVGLFMHHAHCAFSTIFAVALAAGVVGLCVAWCVKAPPKETVKRPPISLDRFMLLRGLPAGVTLLLLSVPYGMTTNYVAMYAGEISLTVQTGFFFTFMAIGMAVSRIISGRWVDKGRITQMISLGFYLVIGSFFLLTACALLIKLSPIVCMIAFYAVALLLGIGFGIMFPAYNTMFVNLAPNNRRATATSTYLTSWDVGVGIGMLSGGYISQLSSLNTAFLFGSLLTLVSACYFHLKVVPHFNQYRLR